MQNLVDYIDKKYRKKKNTPFGSKKRFADAIGMSPQQVTNMLSTDKYGVYDHSLYMESNRDYMVIDNVLYVKCRELPEPLKCK